MNRARANVRLPPEVNRVLYVRNLPYKITAEEMWVSFSLSVLFIQLLKVRHLWEIRRNPADQGRQHPRDERDSFRHLRGHFWRQKCLRPPVWIQCVQQVCNRDGGKIRVQSLCPGIWWSCTTRRTRLSRSWTLRRRRQTCRRWRRNTTWTLLLANPSTPISYDVPCFVHFLPLEPLIWSKLYLVNKWHFLQILKYGRSGEFGKTESAGWSKSECLGQSLAKCEYFRTDFIKIFLTEFGY